MQNFQLNKGYNQFQHAWSRPPHPIYWQPSSDLSTSFQVNAKNAANKIYNNNASQGSIVQKIMPNPTVYSTAPSLNYNYPIILPVASNGNNIIPPAIHNGKIEHQQHGGLKFAKGNLRNQISIPQNIMKNDPPTVLPSNYGNIIPPEIRNGGIKFNGEKGPILTSPQLAITLNNAYKELEDLKVDRESIDLKIARKYPKEGVNYKNFLELYRLPQIHTRVDRLIQDQKLERAKIIMLLVRVEDAIGNHQEIDKIRQKVNDWDYYIHAVCKRRIVERDLIKNNQRVSFSKLQHCADKFLQGGPEDSTPYHFLD